MWKQRIQESISFQNVREWQVTHHRGILWGLTTAPVAVPWLQSVWHTCKPEGMEITYRTTIRVITYYPYRGYYMAVRRNFSSQHEKINFVFPSDHVMFYLLYKHQWNTKLFHLNRRDLLCSHSNGDLFTCEDNMLFSRVKICFRAKAHQVVHWCL